VSTIHRCSCGEQLILSVRHAGQNIFCTGCGKQILSSAPCTVPSKRTRPKEIRRIVEGRETYAAWNKVAITLALVLFVSCGVVFSTAAIMVMKSRRTESSSQPIASVDIEVSESQVKSSVTYAIDPPPTPGPSAPSEADIAAALQQQAAVLQQQKDAEQLDRIRKEADKQVASRARRILALAHPFAKFEGVEIQELTPSSSGSYGVKFDIHYSGATDPDGAWLSFKLNLDDNGEVKDASFGRDTGAIPPGSVILAVDALVSELNENN
jgi:hypothetical protein